MYGLVGQNQTRANAISLYLASNWNEFGSQTPEWGNNIATFPGSAEVHSHFIAGNGVRALQLLTLQWGYMLHSPHSTNSTFWEGYNNDGTFAYQV